MGSPTTTLLWFTVGLLGAFLYAVKRTRWAVNLLSVGLTTTLFSVLGLGRLLQLLAAVLLFAGFWAVDFAASKRRKKGRPTPQ